MASLHPAIRHELDALEIQFPGKAYLTLDDYAALYNIDRHYASKHLKRKGIPATKEGQSIYVSTLDLAIYKANRKLGNKAPLLADKMDVKDEMRRRRGFAQLAERRQLGL